MPDAYDVVAYPSLPRPHTHPAHLAALAHLAGVAMPPVERWRILELGCGDGANLLPFAADSPQGRFVGVDRAASALDRGRARATGLELANLELVEADLLTWDPPGEFDCILAHGVYSWVPEPVREAMLRLCARALAPHGIAFISYNALPGCHFRRYARDLLRFRTRGETDPVECVEQARQLAGILAQQTGDEVLRAAVRQEMQTALERSPAVLYHDDLAEVNDPFYLTDFTAQAARHGLQYLGDAEPQRDDVGGLPQLPGDWLELRQYNDFFSGRRFRETLLCRAGLALERDPSWERMCGLVAASRALPATPEPDGKQRFDLPLARSLTTDHLPARDLICRLAALWPACLPVAELRPEGIPSDHMAHLLWRLANAGAVELRSTGPRVAAAVSERPAASALVRQQLREGLGSVTNQRHQTIELEDAAGRALVALLDGTRDRAALASALVAGGMDSVEVERSLDVTLAGLLRMSLLVE